VGEAGCSKIAGVWYGVRNGRRRLWMYARIVFYLNQQINPKAPVFSVSWLPSFVGTNGQGTQRRYTEVRCKVKRNYLDGDVSFHGIYFCDLSITLWIMALLEKSLTGGPFIIYANPSCGNSASQILLDVADWVNTSARIPLQKRHDIILSPWMNY